LLVANWFFPDSNRRPANSGFEDYGIRIRSAAKLRVPVTFDTSQATIVPPQNPVTVAAQPPLNAFARIAPIRPPDPVLNRQAEKKRKPSRNRASKVVMTRSPALTRIATAVQSSERLIARISLFEAIKERLGEGLFNLN
jgi:hypothetical protein